MDPREHSTPEALFGAEALTDARRLKKAYARWVRRCPPEKDPEGFQHVRALYEVARAALERGAAASPAEETTPATTEAAREGPVGDAWLAQQLDGVTTETLPAVAATLRAHALHTGDADELMGTFALLGALDPEDALTWLADVVEAHPGAARHVAMLLRFSLEQDPDRVDSPAVPLLVERLAVDEGSRTVAVFALCHALSVVDRGAEVWAHFEANEPLLRRVDPERTARAFPWMVEAAAWSVDPDAIDLLLDRIDSPVVELDDAAFERLQAVLAVAREVAVARTDPSVPAVVCDAARLAWTADRPTVTTALLDLQVLDDPTALLTRLAPRYPAIVHAIDRLDQIAHLRGLRIDAAWAKEGALYRPEAERVAEALRDAHRGWEPKGTAAAPPVATGSVAGWGWLAVGIVCARISRQVGLWMGLVSLGFIAVGLFFLMRHRLPDPLEWLGLRPPPPSTPFLEGVLLEACRDTGVLPLHLAASTVAGVDLRADALIGERGAGVRAASEDAVRSAVIDAAMANAEASEESPSEDDAEPDADGEAS